MNKYIYQKGLSIVQVVEIDNQGMIQGLRGLIDMIDLMNLLQANGYKLIS
jgi:hypothetical protein